MKHLRSPSHWSSLSQSPSHILQSLSSQPSPPESISSGKPEGVESLPATTGAGVTGAAVMGAAVTGAAVTGGPVGLAVIVGIGLIVGEALGDEVE